MPAVAEVEAVKAAEEAETVTAAAAKGLVTKAVKAAVAKGFVTKAVKAAVGKGLVTKQRRQR